MKLLKSAILMALMLMIAAPFAMAGACGDSCSESCCAETEVKVYGSARHRLEIDNNTNRDFTEQNREWMQYMRTRLGVKAKRGNSGMVFEVQDSRVLGDTPGTLNGTFTNGNSYANFFGYDKNIGNFANDFGVRQAYLWHQPCEKGGIKVGRFGVSMHNQRLVGEVGWDNVGRTTEGVMFKRAINDNFKVIGAALQVAEQNFDNGDDNATDPMFYALDLHLTEQNVDFFMYMLTGGSDLLTDSDYSAGRSDDVSLKTFGAYSEREFGSNMFYEAMFAMQKGTYEEWATGGDKIDFSGMLVNLQAGIKLEGGTKVSAMFDYTTGDDAATGDEFEAFNNLLYTGHKWNGYMDYFTGAYNGFEDEDSPFGLTDIALRVAHPINETMWVKVDGHMFKTTEEYADGKSSLGKEIDVTLVKKAGDIKIQGGVSMFMPDEDRYGADAETAQWGYLMTTFGF